MVADSRILMRPESVNAIAPSDKGLCHSGRGLVMYEIQQRAFSPGGGRLLLRASAIDGPESLRARMSRWPS